MVVDFSMTLLGSCDAVDRPHDFESDLDYSRKALRGGVSAP
jgi:hypothetical protein